MEHYLECVDCGMKYQSIEVLYVCKKCEGLLDITYDYKKIVDMNLIEKDDKTVRIVTGHGLKDPDIVIKTSNVNLIKINPLQDSINNILGLKTAAVARSI